MIYIKRFTTVITAAALLCVAIIPAFAATTEEIEEQISWCKTVKATAHQMAECARQLGYPEDHTIITEAQSKWWEADAEEKRLGDELASQTETAVPATTWTGSKLTRSKGVNYGPNGKETYYNLPMGGVVRIMRDMGFSEAEYPYWVREDGCKMLGPYIMCAANLNVFPRGSTVECSLGMALVCDTGGFARNNPYQLDIAVVW